MAHITFVVIGLGCKFSAMRFGMARIADQLADFVPGLAALGLMALRATQRGMFSHERKSAAHMSFAVKERRLEACRGVA